jgi:hypothetical protein
MPACRTLAAEKRGAFTMAYSPYLHRGALAGARAVEQMALDFQTFAANAGSISADDLEVLGWTPAQVAALAPAARQYANRRSAR